MADVFDELLGAVPPDQKALIEGLRRRTQYGQLAAASGIGPLSKMGAADVASARGEADTIAGGRRTDANRAEERKFREWIQNQAAEQRGLDRTMRADALRREEQLRRDLAAQSSADKRYAADLAAQTRQDVADSKAKPPPSETTKESAMGFLANIGYDQATGEDEITKLLKNASGGYIKRGINELARAVDVTTPGMKAGATLKSRASENTLGFLGGRLGAGVSNTDRIFMQERGADVGNENLTTKERAEAWRDVRARMLRSAGLPSPLTGGAPPAAAATAPDADKEARYQAWKKAQSQ